jgi:hypothetical protein
MFYFQNKYWKIYTKISAEKKNVITTNAGNLKHFTHYNERDQEKHF